MYTIINKIEYNTGVVYTPVGYIVNNPQLELDINLIYQNFEDWVNENKTDLENETIDISAFFINTSHVYSVNYHTDNIEGFNINEIKNINEL